MDLEILILEHRKQNGLYKNTAHRQTKNTRHRGDLKRIKGNIASPVFVKRFAAYMFLDQPAFVLHILQGRILGKTTKDVANDRRKYLPNGPIHQF